jgi:hypothetical protein
LGSRLILRSLGHGRRRTRDEMFPPSRNCEQSRSRFAGNAKGVELRLFHKTLAMYNFRVDVKTDLGLKSLH